MRLRQVSEVTAFLPAIAALVLQQPAGKGSWELTSTFHRAIFLIQDLVSTPSLHHWHYILHVLRAQLLHNFCTMKLCSTQNSAKVF
jgi:hypothetical protein